MAATEIPRDVQYHLKLDLGTVSPSGNVQTANVSLGKMSVQRFVTDSAYALSSLLIPILDHSAHGELLTRKSQIART